MTEYRQRTSAERRMQEEDRWNEEIFENPEGVVMHVMGSERRVFELDIVIFDDEKDEASEEEGASRRRELMSMRQVFVAGLLEDVEKEREDCRQVAELEVAAAGAQGKAYERRCRRAG